MAAQHAELPERFVVEAELGRGAMGRVLLARDRKLERRVAVKLVLEGEGTVADPGRLAEEARSLAPLRHEAIVSLLDFADDGKLPYIVFEYVEGEDLARHLATHGPLAVPRLFAWGRRIAAGLAYAHERGILHRDLKAENVLLGPSGPKIADFGLALRRDRSQVLTRTGLIMGTPSYMAPELVRGGKATVASEVYAAGVLLFAMATDRFPFERRDVGALLRAHCEETPPSPARWRPDLPPAFCRLVLACLAKDPAARPESLATVEARLAEAERAPAPRRSALTRSLVRSGAGGGETRPVTMPPPAEGSVGRKRLVVLVAAGFLALTLALFAMLRDPAPVRLPPPRIEVACESARISLAPARPRRVEWKLFAGERLLSRGRSDATTAPEILLKALAPEREYRVELVADGSRDALSFRTLPVALTGPLHVTAFRRHLLVELETLLGSRPHLRLRIAGRDEERALTVSPTGRTLVELPPTTPADTAVDWSLSFREQTLARGRCPLFPVAVSSPLYGTDVETKRVRPVYPRLGVIHWMDDRALFLDSASWFQCWERVPWSAADGMAPRALLRPAWLYPCSPAPNPPVAAQSSGAWLPLSEDRLLFVANASFQELRLGELRPSRRRARWPVATDAPREQALRPDWTAPLDGERIGTIRSARSTLGRHLSPLHDGRVWLFVSQQEQLGAFEIDLETFAVTRRLALTFDELAGRPAVGRDATARGTPWTGPPEDFALQTWIVPRRPVFFAGCCWLVACPMGRGAFDDSLGVLLRLPLPGRPGRIEPVQIFRTDPAQQFLGVAENALFLNGHHGLDVVSAAEAVPRPLVAANRMPVNPHVPDERCPLVGPLFTFQGRRHGLIGFPRKMPALFDGGRYHVAFGLHLHLFDEQGRIGARRSKGMIFEAEVAASPGLEGMVHLPGDRIVGASTRHVFVLDGGRGRTGSCQPDPSGRLRGLGASKDGLIATVDGEGRIFFIPDELLLAEGQNLSPPER